MEMKRRYVDWAMALIRAGEPVDRVARTFSVSEDDMQAIVATEEAGIPRFLNNRIERRPCSLGGTPRAK